MTISMAWVRTVGNTQELVFVTDSRLRFAGEWDCCPKLIQMPRQDSALCFAGDTLYAYPYMLQVNTAIQNHVKSLSRALPLEHLKGHLIRILNSMIGMHVDIPVGFGTPETTFIFGGYCWKRNEFLLWLIYYDSNIKKFTFRPASEWRGGHEGKYLVFTGDYKEEAMSRLIKLLREKGKGNSGGFDMEPLEVLRDMLNEGTFNLIGGFPQIMKVYKHMNVRPYAVFSPFKNETSLLGRPLLSYEKTNYITINLDTLETFNNWNDEEPTEDEKS